jgi:hypothetical protein
MVSHTFFKNYFNHGWTPINTDGGKKAKFEIYEKANENGKIKPN